MRVMTQSKPTKVLLTLILLMALCMSVAPLYSAEQKLAPANPTAISALHDLQDAFTSISDQVLPSVVSIMSKRTVDSQVSGMPNDFPFPFNAPPQAPQKHQEVGYGTGVIVRANGYILTNDHVAGGADKVTVKLSDGREFEGKVSRDTKSDLAIVKIDATGLPTAKLGDSARVRVGQWAIAMGSPFELDRTVTVGVISATEREEVAGDGAETRFYPNLIQTDASINPGNSGGPLVNIDGEVVGINTLIRAGGNPMMGASGNIGIGFAIPVNTAKFVLDQLITHGKVTRGFLGLTPVDLTPKMQEHYGVKAGALVKTVEVDGPADKAKFQLEDIITAFDGKKISSQLDLRDVIMGTAPGKKVPVVVMRDKKEQTLNVIVGEAPGTVAAGDTSSASSDEKLGFSVADITPEAVQKFKLNEGVKGVVVTSVVPESPAALEGLSSGLVITALNGTPVKTSAAFVAAAKGLKSGDYVRLSVATTERKVVIAFTLE